MAIISTDVDGATQYSFNTHGSNVVLKAGVIYNYTGNGAAILMDTSSDHFLVAGTIYSNVDGISYNSYGAYLDVAATGLVDGTAGAGVRFVADSGAVTINNQGTIEGQGGVLAGAATYYVDIFNTGLIESDRTLGLQSQNYGAIETGSAEDKVVNTGTIIGDIKTGGNDDLIDTHLGTLVGTIYGGDGNDTYYVVGGQAIREYAHDGSDTVHAYSDYALGDNIENLVLEGTATSGIGNAQSNAITGNDFGNHLSGGGGDDLVVAGSGDDVLRGNAGNDVLQSLEGADVFHGGGGDDILVGGSDAVVYDGGGGIDQAAFLLNDTAVVGNVATNTVTGGIAGTDTLISIEGYYGSAFGDTFNGSAGANYFNGYYGNDIINGLDGADKISGGAGADKLDGGAGLDTLSFADSTNAVVMSLATGTGTVGDAAGDTYANFENILGGAGGDGLTGSAGDNLIEGGAGADIVNAGKGNDTIYGDAGNDQLTGAAGHDIFGFRDVDPKADIVSPGGFGADQINDFQDGFDMLSFVGDSGVHGFADLTVTQSGSSTVINLASGDSITLLLFTAANLTAADCVFG